MQPDWVGVFGRLAEKFDGAYNIVLITGARRAGCGP